MKKRYFAMLVILLMIISIAPTAFAEEETYIVDETVTIIEDHTFDDYGWLSVYANVPMGYEGMICLELKNQHGQIQLIQIPPDNMHVGGAWLLEGVYEVSRIYDPNDMLIGSCETERVEVTHDGDAKITLEFESNPDFTYPEWTGSRTGNSGTIPAPTEEETEATTEETTAETTEAPTTEPAPSQTSEPASEGEESEKKNIVAEVIVTVVVALVFIGIIDYCVIAYRRKRKDTVY